MNKLVLGMLKSACSLTFDKNWIMKISCLTNKRVANCCIKFLENKESFFLIQQGALYGIVVCGITSIRIWLGPLPLEVCHFQTWVKKFVSWYVLFSLLYISLAKFMYICVWKHMRDMNDDLIVAFLVRIAVFISVWVPTTGFNNRKGQSSVVSMCTGIFNDHDQIMNSEFRSDKLPQPYNPIFWSLCVTILCLMAAVMIGRQRNSHKNTNLPIMQKPKDLESMLLNFSLLILLLINMFGYNFYWRG